MVGLLTTSGNWLLNNFHLHASQGARKACGKSITNHHSRPSDSEASYTRHYPELGPIVQTKIRKIRGGFRFEAEPSLTHILHVIGVSLILLAYSMV